MKFFQKKHEVKAEPVLMKAAEKPVAPLSSEEKDKMLGYVFDNAKAPRRGFVGAVKSVPMFAARFAPVVIRAVVLTMALALFAGGAWMMAPAPVAMGSETGHTIEVARNAQLRVVFNQRMDHKSAESALSIAPPMQGKIDWSDNVLIFTPSTLLEKGVTYEVSVGTGAMNFYGKHLLVPFRQWFAVTNDPEVSVVAPGNGSEIKQNQVLTVIFDHPIRNLTGSLKVPDLLTIQPVVAGHYNWLGTSGFEFIPKDGWTPATDFTVTVPTGFEFADGSKLTKDYSWIFHTADLQAWQSSSVQHHRTKEPVSITFNYPVKVEEVKKALTIKENGNALSLALFAMKPATGLSTVVSFTPYGTFKLGASYSLELAPGFTGGVGTRPMPNAYASGFAMDEVGFKLTTTCPGDGGLKSVWDEMVLGFNNPIDAKNLASFVTVSPAIENMSVMNDAYVYNCSFSEGRGMSVSGTWKASTKYTVSLKPGLKDIYGQVYSGAKKFSFTTNAYDASIELSSYSDQGILASHLPRLYQARVRNLSTPLTVTLSQDGRELAKKDYDTKADLNTHKVINVDLDEIAGHKLAGGRYSVQFYEPDLPYDWNRTIFRDVIIVDTALTLKQDNSGKLLVWATDMQSGEPVAGLKVAITAYGSGEATTDANGLATLNASKSGQLTIEATGSGHYGVVGGSWSDGISSWNYNLQPSYGNHLNGYVGTIYTDRKIYRPDQKVMFKGVIRQDFDAKYSLPKQTELDVTIDDPDGAHIYQQKLPLSRFGSFQGEIQLQSVMKLGDYRIMVNPSGVDSWDARVTGIFTVSEFRRPDFKVTVDAPTTPVVSGVPMLVKIGAQYYSGAPLGGGIVNYTVSRRSMNFQPLDGEWFNFTDGENSDCYWYCSSEGNFETVLSDSKALSTDGILALTVPTNLATYKSNATYTIEASVEDVNHRFVSNRVELPVYKADFSLGVRANYDKGWDSPSLDFDVVSVNNDATMRANVSGTAKFYHRVWTNSQKESIDGSTTWDSSFEDTLVGTSYFLTGNDGRAAIGFAPTQDGEYYAIVATTDPHSNAVSARASRYFYQGSLSTIRVTDDHMLKIVQNKADYKVGDTASIVVQTPYEHTKALVTIERETIRETRVIDLTPENHTILVPITEDAVPNIYVSVMAIKGGGDGVPEFRMGYANLLVDTQNKILDINLTTDKKTYKPGEKVTINIEAKRRGGGPEQAEVSLAVVDERIVALLGSVDKNILGAFWFRRQIGVDTMQTLTKLVKKVFVETGMAEGDGKGGSDTGVPIRGNFQDTAYWNAAVETDAQGHASISFNLPDNLTDWQVLAIGNTKDTVVGSAEAAISTRRDLTVEPLLPRFVRYGDTVKLGASVENGTGIGKSIDVKIKADGLTVTDGVTRTIWVAPHTRAGVTWNVTVPYNVTTAQITVTGVAADVSDGYTMSLPVLPYSVAEMVTASNILQKSATETVVIPDEIIADQSSIRVAVSPNVGQGLASGVDYLLKYEYGCSEQTASAVIAGTLYEELAKQKFTNASDADIQASKTKVNDGIRRLVAMQRTNGGFAYWQESTYEYPHLTAYVLWGLYQAKQAGFSVDQGAMDRAADYLLTYLSSVPSESQWLSQSEKAQAVFVLSEMGRSKISGYADTLYENRAGLSVFAKGFLAMAYMNIDGRTTAKTTQLMMEIENNIVYLDPTAAYVHENDGYSSYMSTDLRSTSITLMAYLRIDPKNANTERLVRWMMRQKSGGYWETTQNTSFALFSLIEYAKKTPIDTAKVDVNVFLDGQVSNVLTLANGDTSSEVSTIYRIDDLLTKGTTHQFGLDKANDKRYFYDVTMKVYRQIQDIKPFENGFTVISDYYAKDDVDHVTPITQAKVGDVVRVRMKLIVPKRKQYVAFEHHLPAGLEPIDFQLRTSNQSLQNGGDGKGGGNCTVDLSGYQNCIDEYSWEWNWWWENVWKHTELRDDRTLLFADDVTPGIYEYEFFAQAVTPGEFRVPPARAYEMYTPATNGHNEGKVFRVTAAQ